MRLFLLSCWAVLMATNTGLGEVVPVRILRARHHQVDTQLERQ